MEYIGISLKPPSTFTRPHNQKEKTLFISSRTNPIYKTFIITDYHQSFIEATMELSA